MLCLGTFDFAQPNFASFFPRHDDKSLDFLPLANSATVRHFLLPGN